MSLTPPRRMTAEDASFLYFEKPEMPMHVGSVMIFDGHLPFDEFAATVEAKLHLLPRYRQKIVPPPFLIGHPAWEYDPAFDIRQHVFQVKVKAPGSDEQLRALAGKLFSGVMDRNKPLWDIYLVEGLEGGRSAMISRVHHCMVDGVAGVGLANVLLDMYPDAPRPEKQEYHPPAAPDPLESLMDAFTTQSRDTVSRVMSTGQKSASLTQSWVGSDAQKAFQTLSKFVTELSAPTQKLPFNRACSGQRLMAWSDFSFAEARAIRGALGGTVNDVALAVLAGAISRYAQAHKIATKGRTFRVMAPVNIRTEDSDAYGNRISALFIPLPLDIDDPAKRLKAVSERTDALKKAQLADAIAIATTWMGIAPPSLQAFWGSLPYSPMMGLPFNMVCTNVPGPQVPLFTLGKRMLTYYPHVPVGNELGVCCAIQSYNQRLFFGLTADKQAMPDVDKLKGFMDESFYALRKAAGVEEMEPAPTNKSEEKKGRRKKAALAE